MNRSPRAAARPARRPDFHSAGLRVALGALVVAAGIAMSAGPAHGADPEYASHGSPTSPGIAYGFIAGLTRTGGSLDYNDFTVAAQLTARNAAGVNQWAFGAATEAWALPGSRSILVGIESAVINQEPSNDRPKVASSAVFKNRPDGEPQDGPALNRESIAYWVSAQPGTGFERGLVFHRDSLLSERGRPVAIDLSDIPDDAIEGIDLIRIRQNVTLRYVAASRALVLHIQ